MVAKMTSISITDAGKGFSTGNLKQVEPTPQKATWSNIKKAKDRSAPAQRSG